MEKINLGQTIAILANIGVIAGIIFLAIEVGQNQASLEEANRLNERMIRDTAIDRLMAFSSLLASSEQLADLWIRGLGDEELTQTEELRFGQLCQMEIWQAGIEASNFRAEGVESSSERLVYSFESALHPAPDTRDAGTTMRRVWEHLVQVRS